MIVQIKVQQVQLKVGRVARAKDWSFQHHYRPQRLKTENIGYQVCHLYLGFSLYFFFQSLMSHTKKVSRSASHTHFLRVVNQRRMFTVFLSKSRKQMTCSIIQHKTRKSMQ